MLRSWVMDKKSRHLELAAIANFLGSLIQMNLEPGILFDVFNFADDEFSLIFGKIGPDVYGLLVDLFNGPFHRTLLLERECHFVAFGHVVPPVVADVLVAADSVLVSVFASVAGAGALSVFSLDLLPFFPPPAESTGFL